MSAGILNIVWQNSMFASLFVMLAAVSLAIWWIIRKRLRDFQLPVLKVLEFPSSRLPRLIVKKPPLIPFLMFAMALLALVLWTWRPSLKAYSDYDHEVASIHIFVDMSPSVSAQIGLNELSTEVSGLISMLGLKSRVTLGSSHGQDIYEVTNPELAADVIKGLGFHRAGTKIGTAVRAQIGKVGDIDQLIVVSDRDQHSWSGFQWQYFLIDADIRFKDLDGSAQRLSRPNIFIQDARYTGSPDSLKSTWDVIIAEGSLVMPASGTISASIGGQVVATESWSIDAARKSTMVSMSWPSAKVVEGPESDVIVWTLEVSGGDALQMDNIFRSPARGRRDLVAVIGEPSGELRLDDPLMPLESALAAAGFSVARFDVVPRVEGFSLSELLGNPGTTVVHAGLDTEIDDWCPGRAGNAAGQGGKGQRVWMLPPGEPLQFSGVCRCVNLLRPGSEPLRCDTLSGRDDFISALKASGWFQIGGDAGEDRGAIAWRWGGQKEPELMVFTLPLKPGPGSGITWGDFPFLIRDLMRISTNRINETQAALDLPAWPRFADGFAQSQLSGGEGQKAVRDSNVPVGESLLALVPLDTMPPLYGSVGGLGNNRAPSKRDSDDPKLWIYFLVALVILSALTEILWSKKSGRVTAAKVAALALSFCLYDSPALGQLSISMIPDRESAGTTFQNLAREVSGRTSIELSAKPDFVAGGEALTADTAWVWTSSLTPISKDGILTASVRRWVTRGGLVIIEGSQNDQALDKLTRDFGVGQRNAGKWDVLAPDHEMMRSFYLLSSLPGCKGQTWKIFTVDGRGAIISLPFSILSQLRDIPSKPACDAQAAIEQQTRAFINLTMMAMTTDYKKDQIHLPEILKRLRVP